VKKDFTDEEFYPASSVAPTPVARAHGNLKSEEAGGSRGRSR